MDNYIDLVLKTEPSSEQYQDIIERIKNPQIIRLLHSLIGIQTESGELLDAIKKYIFYGKTLDLINISEELGDLSWYKAVCIDALAILMNQNSKDLDVKIKINNIAKLQARYADKFSPEDAINRNIDAERKVLEK